MEKDKTALACADIKEVSTVKSVLTAYKSIEMSDNAAAAVLRWMLGRGR
jgi:hypothetical protein